MSQAFAAVPGISSNSKARDVAVQKIGAQSIVDAGTGGSTPLGDARPDAPACQYPTGSCCRSCAVLSAHGCPEGKPTAGGISCETESPL